MKLCAILLHAAATLARVEADILNVTSGAWCCEERMRGERGKEERMAGASRLF